MGLLHVYDDDDWRMQLMTKRKDAELVLPIKGGALKLVEALDRLVAQRKHFDRIVIETHGGPGKIGMGKHVINARWIRSLSNRHYGYFCDVGCRLYFNGCNVAEGEVGWDFLRAAAEVFLIKNGGVCFGHTSMGWQDMLTGHVVHPWGDTREVVMMPGGDAI